MDQSKQLTVSTPTLKPGETVTIQNKSPDPVAILPDGRVDVTPAMAAYAVYNKLVSGLAIVDMVSTAELEALKEMLSRYRWIDELEHKVILSMLDYVNAELVKDKIEGASIKYVQAS